MHRLCVMVAGLLLWQGWILALEPALPNGGRGAGTVPIWNPYQAAPGNAPLAVRVLVLNYNPIVPFEQHRRLSEVFGWSSPERLATDYKEAMEYASGGYLRFEIVEWRNLNEIYAQENGARYTVQEYVRNRRQGRGWRSEGAMADYPRLLYEQNVVRLIDEGIVDEVWIFSDHFFGLWEASMAGPGAFFINGGVYPQVSSRRPFAFYGFNYERGVAEMMHNTSHRTEATLNRVYGPWNLKNPTNNWEKFSANHDQSDGVAGVGTCHWPANAASDYDYGNERAVPSWADAFLSYPNLKLDRKPVSRQTWSRGPDYHLDYMKWYFAHIPRAAGVNADRKQNNWFKYIFDFQSYDAQGQPLPPAAELLGPAVADPLAEQHTIAIAYRSAEQIDTPTLGDSDLAVTGPDGQTLSVKLTMQERPAGRSYYVGRYRIAAPRGTWAQAPVGEYVVALKNNEVRTAAGTPFPPVQLGAFRVAAAQGAAPLATDAETTLLLRFEGDAVATPPRAPLLQENLRYEPGLAGKGAAFAAGSRLSYPVAGVLDPQSGTVEFWIRPRWDGNAQQPHVFFQAGRAFDNALLMQIDGANNVRLITWGDDPDTAAVEKNAERGVAFSGAEWKAGEWHHLAATWDEAGRRLALYVDGRLADATTQGIVLGPLSTEFLSVGTAIDGAYPADAVLDELRVSKIARSAQAIRSSSLFATFAIDGLDIEIPTAELLLGARGFPRVEARANSGRRQDVTREVVWSSTDPRVVAIDAFGTLRARRAGQATITARLGPWSASAMLKVSDPGLPSARLRKAAEVRNAAAGPASITVTYKSAAGMRRDSVGMGDLRVVGPNGFHQFPEVVSVEGAGEEWSVTYQVKPRNGKWGEGDRGQYRIEMMAFQVSDEAGLYVPEQVIGHLRVLTRARPK